MNTQTSNLDLKLPTENPHYYRAVTQMGDGQEVTAEQDIFAANGMKLLAKGAKINSHQFEILTNHKLSMPLDLVLTTDRHITGEKLAFEAGKVIEQNPLIARLLERTGDPLAVKHQLTILKLPAPVKFRLTVMQDQRPGLFKHALRTTLVSYALGQQLQLSSIHLNALTLASLCHDLGEMHTDPEVLSSGHRISVQERRYIHVHPITSFMLVHDLPGFPALAAQAILQHHERLDGSGYPYGLKKEKICLLAQISALADVTDAVSQRADLARLDMLFTLNQSRFSPVCISALRNLMKTVPHKPCLKKDQDPYSQLAHITDLLHTWLSLHALLKNDIEASSETALGFLFERMGHILTLLVQAGLNLEDIPAITSFAQNDPAMLAELHTVLSELEWLLADLANEIERRAPDLDAMTQIGLDNLIIKLRSQ